MPAEMLLLLVSPLAGSLALTFFVYVFINAGMVTGLLPVVGVPLPLVSYGGSSLVITMFLVGLLFNVGRRPEHHAPTVAEKQRELAKRKRMRVRVVTA